jgi:hypothetical protein
VRTIVSLIAREIKLRANLTHLLAHLQEKMQCSSLMRNFAVMQNFSISLGGNKMNTLRQLCVAIALSLVLAVSVLAGQISSPGAIPPPPTGTATATSTEPIESTNFMTTIFLTIINLIPTP